MTVHSQLPAWLQNLTLEPHPVAVIDVDNDRFTVTIDGKTLIFNDVFSAYAHAETNPGGEWFTAAAVAYIRDVLDGNIISDDEQGQMISVQKEGDDLYTLLSTFTDESSMNSLMEDVEHFGMVAEDFRDNNDDVMCAWYFIDGHPALWTRAKAEGRAARLWETIGYANTLTVMPVHTDNGVKVMIEGGEHDLDDDPYTPAGTTHVLNERLTVEEDSWEEAILAFAAKLDTLFDETGTPR